MSYIIGSTRNCIRCGKPYKVRNAAQKYCCEECKYQAQLERQRERFQALPQKRCVGCGKWYTPTKPWQKYCSRACAGATNKMGVRQEPFPEPVQTCRIRILEDIPVKQEMQPLAGEIYEAEHHERVPGCAAFWIIRVNGHRVIVKGGESPEAEEI